MIQQVQAPEKETVLSVLYMYCTSGFLCVLNTHQKFTSSPFQLNCQDNLNRDEQFPARRTEPIQQYSQLDRWNSIAETAKKNMRLR